MKSGELAELSAGTISLALPTLTLTQEAQPSPIVYRGGGHVQHGGDGRFVVKLLDAQARMRLESPSALGQLLADDAYFTLDGIDLWNRRWTANRIRIEESWSVTTVGAEIVGVVPLLETFSVERHPVEGVFLQMVFPDQLPLPMVGPTTRQTPLGPIEITTWSNLVGPRPDTKCP